MHSFGSRENGLKTRRQHAVNDFVYHKSRWMENGTGPFPSPNVLLIEQGPNSLLRPHFHRQNQFQLFMEGGGTIGAHAVQPFMLHYAGAYTGYGPIKAGPNGLSYMTLRASWDEGAGFLPEARGALPKGPRRHAMSVPFAASAKPGPGITITSLIERTEDGVEAELVAIGAGHTAGLPVSGAGIFVVILHGSCVGFARAFQRLEQLYVSADEVSLKVTAGTEGCVLVKMTMPEIEDCYRGPLDIDSRLMARAAHVDSAT